MQAARKRRSGLHGAGSLRREARRLLGYGNEKSLQRSFVVLLRVNVALRGCSRYRFSGRPVALITLQASVTEQSPLQVVALCSSCQL